MLGGAYYWYWQTESGQRFHAQSKAVAQAVKKGQAAAGAAALNQFGCDPAIVIPATQIEEMARDMFAGQDTTGFSSSVAEQNLERSPYIVCHWPTDEVPADICGDLARHYAIDQHYQGRLVVQTRTTTLGTDRSNVICLGIYDARGELVGEI